jgi:hypothetical protein
LGLLLGSVMVWGPMSAGAAPWDGPADVSQTTPAPTTPSTPGVPGAPASAASAPNGARVVVPVMPDPAEPKPYDKVITTEAKTESGLFKLHRIKTRLYFEIPKSMLDQPLLMVATVTQVPAGVEHVGRSLGEEMVRFVRNGNRLFLQQVAPAYAVDPAQVNAEAVQRSQREPILAVFQIEAFGPGEAPVIEASRLFLNEFGSLSARAMLRGGGPDASRSYLEEVRAFPASLRVDAVQTYTITPQVMMIPGMPVMPNFSPARSASIHVAYNIVELPKQPMRPRLMDDRVGFFSVGRTDFGPGSQAVKRERFITRWRLEKKDPNAALSEPVKPLVWYIDSATPAELVPYIKKGVEAWNVAFEAAGFKNAIQARPYPSKKDDPEFDPDDVRYSSVRWVPSPVPNAYGPHLADPRSGEILNANVVLFQNIVQLQRDWYITQVGPLDARVRQLPLPNDLMGELVAFVVTHELGHALGFPHNMLASAQYPLDKLRDPAWLKTMGHVPSIMDYSRFNYLVQPEDKVDPALLIPKVGPYDVFATRWGYTPIPSAQTPQDERQQLDLWAKAQDEQPWLRFSSPRTQGMDASDNAEVVGDADPMGSARLGLRNLQRVMALLPQIEERPRADERTLEQLYWATWSQWMSEIGPVLKLVGGYQGHHKHADQPGAVFAAVPRERQQASVRWLGEQLFHSPQWLLDPALTRRLRPAQPELMLQMVQRLGLQLMLSSGRLQQLQVQEQQLGARAYRVDDYMRDLREQLFAELPRGQAISAARRNLQRAYVESLAMRLSFNLVSLDDGLMVMRTELANVAQLARQAAAKAPAGSLQQSHLRGLASLATQALDGGASSRTGTALLAGSSLPRAWQNTDAALAEQCWSDPAQWLAQTLDQMKAHLQGQPAGQGAGQGAGLEATQGPLPPQTPQVAPGWAPGTF